MRLGCDRISTIQRLILLAHSYNPEVEYVHLSNCSPHHLHHRQNLRTDFGITPVVGCHCCPSHIESQGARHSTILGRIGLTQRNRVSMKNRWFRN